MSYISILIPAFHSKETEETEIVNKKKLNKEKNNLRTIRKRYRRLRINRNKQRRK